MAQYDPIQLGIMWDRMISITDEIVETLVRTSFSTVVRESYDLSCMLFDKSGRLLAQGTYSLPTFTGTAPRTIGHILKRFPAETLSEGDVLMTNDPWLGTGHMFDVNVVRPIFYNGTLVGFTMSITHLPDIGGTGFSSVAREIYEEGLRIPICKISRGGKLDQTIVDFILNNVRVNEAVIGDIIANITCNEVGARLVAEMMEEYGLFNLEDLSRQIIEQSSNEMRRAIGRVPNGTYRNQMIVEGLSEPIKIACQVDVRHDSVGVDFAGSGGPMRAGFNVPLCYSSAMARYALKCLVLPNIPNNQGSIAPIDVVGPAGCILNALHPWPTGGRHVIGHYVMPLVFGAMSACLPDRVHADPGMIDLLNMQGRHRDGAEISGIYFAAGGYGALCDMDGPDVTPSPSNMSGMSTEVWEALTSITVESKSLLADSGGAGERRGGLGQEIAFRNDTGGQLVVSAFAQRTEYPPAGFNEALAGRRREHRINGISVGKLRRYLLEPGDKLTAIEAGGGGFGDPRKRPVEFVVADWKKGFITLDGALDHYGVSIDPERSTGQRVS